MKKSFSNHLFVLFLQPVGGGPAGDYNANAAQQRGKYDYYNEYLDKLEKDREIRKRQEGVPAKGIILKLK